MTVGQVAYAVDPATGIPGLLSGTGHKIKTFIAKEDLEFGRFYAMHSTTDAGLEHPEGDTVIVVGVACYVGMTMGSYPQGSAVIKAGTPVAIVIEGDVFVSFDGGSATYGLRVNVKNDAGGEPTKQGMATATAVDATNIRALAGATFVRPNDTSSLALVRLNLPT